MSLRPGLALAPDHSHADPIRRLAKAGVVSGGVGGAPADCFGPELDVRRDQMASFLARQLSALVDAGLTSPP